MPFTKDGTKWSCDVCIRGHRAIRCRDWGNWMFQVGKAGRPLRDCPHHMTNCQCKKRPFVMVMIGIDEEGKCLCKPADIQPPGPLPTQSRKVSKRRKGGSPPQETLESPPAPDPRSTGYNQITQANAEYVDHQLRLRQQEQAYIHSGRLGMPGPISWAMQGYSFMNGATQGPSVINQPPVPGAGFADMSLQHTTVHPPSIHPQEQGIGPCPSHIPLPDQSYNDSCAISMAMLPPTTMHQPPMIPEPAMMLQPSFNHQQHGPDPTFNQTSKPPPDSDPSRFGTQNMVYRGVAGGTIQVSDNTCCSITTTAEGCQPSGLEESSEAYPQFFRTDSAGHNGHSLLGDGPQGGQYPNDLPTNIGFPNNGCECGPTCNCLRCTTHPNNPANLEYTQEMAELLESQLDEYSTTVSRPQSSYGEPAIMPGPLETQTTFGHQTFAENYDHEGPPYQRLVQPNYFTMAYPVIGSCENGSCRCGDNCACEGCLTHLGHGAL